MKLIDYINVIGHHAFDSIPYTEVDILALNELVYILDLDILANLYMTRTNTTLYDYAQAFRVQQSQLSAKNPFLVTTPRINLLYRMSQCVRFREILLSDFRHKYDLETEVQYFAVLWHLNDAIKLVCFRGTDDTIIGWKEDFNMSYQEHIPAQMEAKQFVYDMVDRYADAQWILAGHSKGGNLAIYASVLNYRHIQHRLLGVYAFDAPGFKDDFLMSDHYDKSRHVIHTYFPTESIVGRIMFHGSDTLLVQSNNVGLNQHNVMNWEIAQLTLKRADEFTPVSQRIKVVMDNWVRNHAIDEKAQFVNAFFSMLLKAGIVSVNDLNQHFLDYFPKMVSVIHTMDTESKTCIITTIQELLNDYLSQQPDMNTHVLWIKQQIDQFIVELNQHLFANNTVTFRQSHNASTS